MTTLLNDLRYGIRMLLKKPGVTLVAVLALALGIGANTAVFSIINAILLKPLPFDDLDRIVTLWERVPSQGVDRNEVAVANYVDWRKQSNSFEHLAVYTWWNANLTGVDAPERLRGFRASANIFDTVGVKPALGRGFNADEDQPGKDNVVILSHGLWQRRFASDPGIVGKTISLNGLSRTVVGVLPKDVVFPRGADLIAPMAMTPEVMRNRGSHGNLSVGKLKAGVTLAQAQADIDAIARRLEQQYPNSNTGRGVGVFPILADTVRQYKAAALVMMAAVCFVLLIACANVANLMLARASSRVKEMTVRLALGASRWRIIRQVLLESVILAVVGGALGIAFAVWGLEGFKLILPDDAQLNMPGFNQLGVNRTVLLYTLAISVVTGILFGLAPALQSAKLDLNETLKEGGGRASSGAGSNRLRNTLVVAEIALSLVLLIGAGLLMKSFVQILKSNPGFVTDNVLTMSLSLPAAKYKDEAQRREFYQELLRRIETLPGVETAAAINYLPLGGSNSSSDFLVEGIPEPPPGQEFQGRHRACTPDYFATMGMTVLKGRSFTAQDHQDARPVAIVNEALAKQYWPNADPIGQRIRFPGDLAENPWMEVVGVIADVRHEMNTPATPEYYLPFAQEVWSTMVLTIKSQTEPMALAAPVRAALKTLDQDQPVSDIRSLTEVKNRSVMHYRISGMMMGFFGLFALILAATGIYGVMAYSVSQRTHEIGIRMALGARTGDVLRQVLRQGMKLAGIGAGIGLLAGIGINRAMMGVMFGITTIDWLTFAIVTGGLLLVALLACFIPALRATRVDPMIALRYE